MELLQDFASKDMIEQITILNEIKEANQVEAIGSLFNLCAQPLGDQAVDEMIYHCLFDLLANQTDKIIAGLNHDSEAVQLLCVRRAASQSDSDALKNALAQLLARTSNSEIIGELVQALSNFQDPDLIDTLLPYLRYEDCSVAAWAMQGLAAMESPKVRDALISILKESKEIEEQSVGCELPTALAVENLARFADPKTIDFIVGFIHHPNPSFRRVIISSLAKAGEAIIPALGRFFEFGDADEKIMAANIIGISGLKKGADLLVEQLEKVDESNLKFAIYEALGHIPSMRSVVSLIDGLAEQEELVLMAVMTGLDHQCNPGVIKKLNELLDHPDSQGKLVLATLINSHAQRLFTALYKSGQHRESLLQAVVASGNREAIDTFRSALEALGNEEASKDAQRLVIEERGAGEKRILAADDSKAMLFFYKAVATDMGFDLITVEDGKAAFDHLQLDSKFDLIITDMNMPNMDGIELTKEIRKCAEWKTMPILMATTESESSQAEMASKAGVTDFITKPFSKEDFKTKINQMFP